MLGAECNLYGVRVNKLCEGQVQLQSFVAAAAAVAKSLESCPTLCDPIDGSPPGSPVPGILQARTLTGVGCHFLLQSMKVKSEREVAQSCPTLRDPMDCSPPGSFVHGICQARVLEWVAFAFFERHAYIVIMSRKWKFCDIILLLHSYS